MLSPMLLNSITSSSATSTPTPSTTPNRTPTPTLTPTPSRARCSFPPEAQQTAASWSPQYFGQRMNDANTSQNSTLERQTDISGFILQESNHQSTLKNSFGSHNAHHSNEECGLERFSLDAKQLSLGGSYPIGSMTGPIKRGLLWQQRDRLFSRWKERYFVLTRDYLHCFKRASGSSIEYASDMGQFLFKVKLIDVEKVEWLTRRSYTAVGLLLAREGRVLLRCESGLLDWYKLLKECTITSKERRKALNISQSPRSRASLAAPISHASLQSQYFGLVGVGGHFNDLNDCWLNNSSASGLNLTDSENNHHRMPTSNSEMPITNNSFAHKSLYEGSDQRYSNNFSLQKNVMKPVNDGSLYASSKRLFVNSSLGIAYKENEDDLGEQEVELRRHPRFNANQSIENANEPENESLDMNYLYRKPRPPTESRHSIQPLLPTHNNTANRHIIEGDYLAEKCNLDKTPSSSVHRPLSYREKYNSDYRNIMTSTQKLTATSTDLTASKHFGSSIAFLGKHLQKQKQQQQQQFNKLLHSNVCGSSSRLNTQDQSRLLKANQNERDCFTAVDNQMLGNRQWQLNKPTTIDTNHNFNNRLSNKSTESLIAGNTSANKYVSYACNNTNTTSSIDTTNNNHSGMLSKLSSKLLSSIYNGQRYYDRHQQREVVATSVLESNNATCRDRSYSDCYQRMQRRNLVDNNPTPLTT